MTRDTALIFVGFSTAIAFAALARHLWRGRRQGDGPTCRRCGYDLRGRDANSTRCVECGADLTVPHAITTGERLQRKKLAAALLIVAAVAALTGGVFAKRWAEAFDWLPYEPLSWVLAQARPQTESRAATELLRRSQANHITAAQSHDVAVVALKQQASSPFGNIWSQIIESEETAGRLPSADWRLYVRAIVTPRQKLPESVRAGGRADIHHSVDISHFRASVQLTGSWATESIAVDGNPLTPITEQGDFAYGQSSGHGGSFALDRPLKVAKGEHSVHSVLTVHLTARPSAVPTTRPSEQWDERYTLDGTFVAVEPEPANPLDMATARSAMTQHLSATAWRRRDDEIAVRLKADALPMPIAARLRLSTGGQPLVAAQAPYEVLIDRRDFDQVYFFSINTLHRPLPGTIDVELRPDEMVGRDLPPESAAFPESLFVRAVTVAPLTKPLSH